MNNEIIGVIITFLLTILIAVPLGKYMSRIFKDEKMIFSIFILPIILIVGMLTLVGTMAKNASSDVQKHVSTVYIQNAPSEFKSLMSTVDSNSNGIIFLNVNDDTSSIQTDILKEKTDLLIVFPDCELFTAYLKLAGTHKSIVPVGTDRGTISISEMTGANFSRMESTPQG